MTSVSDEFLIFLKKYNFNYGEVVVILNTYLIYCGVREGFFGDIIISDMFHTFLIYLKVWRLKYVYDYDKKKLFITKAGREIPSVGIHSSTNLGKFLGYIQPSEISGIIDHNFSFTFCVSLFRNKIPDNDIITLNMSQGLHKFTDMQDRHNYYVLWSEKFDYVPLDTLVDILIRANKCLSKINSYGYIIVYSRNLQKSIVMSIENIDVHYEYFNNFLQYNY